MEKMYIQSQQSISKVLENSAVFSKLSNQFFELIDINDNGHLSTEDFKKFLNVELAQLGIKDQMPDCLNIPQIFTQIDKDNSKTVSPEEFASMLRDMFSHQKSILDKAIKK